MKKRNLWFLSAALLLILAGCGTEPTTPTANDDTNSPPPSTEEESTGDQPEGPASEAEESIDEENAEEPAVEELEPIEDPQATPASLLDYFLPDISSAYYEGVGNEFAEIVTTTSRVGQDYVIIHEDNGGSYIQKVYKLDGDKILLVKNEPVEINGPLPTLSELDAMMPIRTYLQEPIEVGTTFNSWTITETDASLQTPFQQFEDVVVMEEVDGEFTNRIYLAEGFGEVKRESIMEISGEPDFIVTSTLENVTEP